MQDVQGIVQLKLSYKHSHLPNKREVTLTDLEKKNPPSTFIDFLNFPPSTPRLLQYVLDSFFQKIPPSTFIPTSTTIRDMRVRRLLCTTYFYSFYNEEPPNHGAD